MDSQSGPPQGASRMPGAIGVLLLNLGGPDNLDAVEPFLYNLFSDREIIQLPGGPLLQPQLARLIARLRSRKTREYYRSIGGGSPLLRLTRQQAAALESRLNAESTPGPENVPDRESPRFFVRPAMRYWHPFTDEALAEMRRLGVERVVALTLYPQFSAATTGSSLNELGRAAPREGFRLGGDGGPGIPIAVIDRYPDHPAYLEALADTICESLDALPEAEREATVLLFSAHGLPIRFIRSGDPYVDEIKRTRDGVLERLSSRGHANPWRQGYQSRTGPVRWIGPYTDRVIEDLAREGVRSMLVIPIAFVSDHIETLFEIDQLFAAGARRLGIPVFRRTRMLNDDPKFISALADLVRTRVSVP